MRRHTRMRRPYQPIVKIGELFDLLKTKIYPAGISDNEFKKLLYAMQYHNRFPAKASKSGRTKFAEAFLFDLAGKIKSYLLIHHSISR